MSKNIRQMTAIYLKKGEKMLLLHREGGRISNGLWVGAAGGHFESEDNGSAYRCVLRELNEELHLSENDISNLKLRYITTREVEDEIRQNFYFFAELKCNTENLTSNEGTLKWFTLSELSRLEMPFTAVFMIRHYIDEGRENDKLYIGTALENDVVFTEIE